MPKFLGRGWMLPLQATREQRADSAHFAQVSEDACVRQAIEIILSTAKGERLMRPEFGCALHELVFAPNDARTQGLAESYVRDALLQWEPRIDVLDVQVQSDGVREERLQIRIDYRIRANDTRTNLVYPFYLERGNV